MRQLIIFHRADRARQTGYDLAARIPGSHFAPSEALSILAYDGICGDHSVIEMVSQDYNPDRLCGKRYDLVTYDHGVVLDEETRFRFESLVR